MLDRERIIENFFRDKNNAMIKDVEGFCVLSNSECKYWKIKEGGKGYCSKGFCAVEVKKRR